LLVLPWAHQRCVFRLAADPSFATPSSLLSPHEGKQNTSPQETRPSAGLLSIRPNLWPIPAPPPQPSIGEVAPRPNGDSLLKSRRSSLADFLFRLNPAPCHQDTETVCFCNLFPHNFAKPARYFTGSTPKLTSHHHDCRRRLNSSTEGPTTYRRPHMISWPDVLLAKLCFWVGIRMPDSLRGILLVGRGGGRRWTPACSGPPETKLTNQALTTEVTSDDGICPRLCFYLFRYEGGKSHNKRRTMRRVLDVAQVFH
jgi:hypothetical protein